MFEVSTYIWGIRYGFKEKHALYPEKVRLSDPEKIKEYDLIVQSFTEEKDSWFRNCKRDFYFMHETNGYKLYSLVVSNHNDIAGRKSFIVFSLVCPTGKSLIGNVTEVLNQLKALYKEKNADETIDRNLFTAEQVNRLVQTLSVGNQISSQNVSKSIFHIKNDDVSKVFHDYVGNEIYYIIEGSNAEMINSMPNHFMQRKFSDRKPTGPSPLPSTETPTKPTTPSTGPTPGDKVAGTGAHTAIEEKIIHASEKPKKNNWHDDNSEIDKQKKQEPKLEDSLKGNTWEPAPTKNRKPLILTLFLVGLTLFIGVWGIISFVNPKSKKVEKGKENGGHTEVINDSTRNNNDVEVEEVSNDSVRIPFEGKDYLLDKKFTSENGMIWGNGSNYRYINSTWQIQINPPKGGWTKAPNDHITVILKSLVERRKAKIFVENTGRGGNDNGGDDENNDDDDDDDDVDNTPNDIYWIELSRKTEEQLQAIKSEIETSLSLKPATSRAGISARRSVNTKYQSWP